MSERRSERLAPPVAHFPGLRQRALRGTLYSSLSLRRHSTIDEARPVNATPQPMTDSSNWIWFALGSALFAGLTALFGKLGVASIDSNVATLIRTVIIGVLVAGIVIARGASWKATGSIPLSTWVFLALSGVATGLSWLCYYRALQIGPVSKVAPVDKLSIVFAIAFSALFLGEPLTLPVLVGAILMTAGAVIIIVF